PDHKVAIHLIVKVLTDKEYGVVSDMSEISAVGHRVVHGGEKFTCSVMIDDAVLDAIKEVQHLAPLHNPPNISGIEAAQANLPDVPHVAIFDTAFHQTMPEHAYMYPVPYEWYEKYSVRRYGFHGLSYRSLVEHLPAVSESRLPGRLLALHLGNGASLCAIRNGKSVATTMGYSPLDGLTMGTRCGGIDANAVLRMVEDLGLAKTARILNTESGLRGLSGGVSDMQRLLDSRDAATAFAVDHFCYWVNRHAGSLMAAMGGLDAVAFTGGIGENAPAVRQRVCLAMEWLGVVLDPDANRRGGPRLHASTSDIPVWIVPAREDLMIARDARSLLRDRVAV
ncbi:MAG: acetate/propionate family kinase, partial [Paracoccaceae bacterium]